MMIDAGTGGHAGGGSGPGGGAAAEKGAGTGATMQVFVSHSHEDDTFCQAIVAGLRAAGADVWYDESNMGSGRLGPTIERELRRRPIFVVVLSPAALRSQWVEDETRWAYSLLRKDPGRLIQPVTAAALTPRDIWLFLEDFKRIERDDTTPYAADEAVRRLLRALALTPAGEAAVPTEARPNESATELVERAKALWAQQRWVEMLPLAERAVQLAPDSFDAWLNLGRAYGVLGRYSEAVAADDRALALDPRSSFAWTNRGVALFSLKRYDEALAAYDRALALDPALFRGWTNKAAALETLMRYDDALEAYDRALALDPSDAAIWFSRGLILSALARFIEALGAYDRALALDPTNARAWDNRAALLHNQARYAEAVAAREQQLRLEPQYAQGWRFKAQSLRALGRFPEADEADRRAAALGG